MRDRDAHLLMIRPDVPHLAEAIGPMEAFQNRTLRPILKLQNPVVLSLVRVYLENYCPKFDQMDSAKQRQFVRNVLSRDSRPRHMLVGIVAGHFTEEEFSFFCAHEAEARRRLMDLCIKRVQDQVEHLGAS